MIVEPTIFRFGIDELISEFPEFFPQNIVSGYTLHDILPPSRKMPAIRLRRIKLRDDQEVFTIRPSFVMPYMTGYSDDVEKALFLRKWTVSYDALVYLFGRDENYWYRLENRFGRNSILGTTVKKVEELPKDLLADETCAELAEVNTPISMAKKPIPSATLRTGLPPQWGKIVSWACQSLWALMRIA